MRTSVSSKRTTSGLGAVSWAQCASIAFSILIIRTCLGNRQLVFRSMLADGIANSRHCPVWRGADIAMELGAYQAFFSGQHVVYIRAAGPGCIKKPFS
ncbi:MAG: hypothetical protein LBS48_00165 [Treponema sp.]|nr:hypothetical protein [Treponema sp.]